MALLLRKVKQHRWYKEQAARFLEIDDVPADPFADLQTAENMLSVWEVVEDRSNLMRVVRAIAIGGQRIDHTGYILFDSAYLKAEEIEVQKNEDDPMITALTAGIETSYSLAKSSSRWRSCYSSTERQVLSRSRNFPSRLTRESGPGNYRRAAEKRRRQAK